MQLPSGEALPDMYTQVAAEVVSRLYARDIEGLQYSTWDGVGRLYRG